METIKGGMNKARNTNVLSIKFHGAGSLFESLVHLME